MNKNRFWFLLAFAAMFSLISTDASAQKKKAKKKTYNTKKKVTTAKVKPVTDTVPSNTTVIASDSLTVPMPEEKHTLRATSAARPTVDANGRKYEKTPLAYENLREDDQLYKQVIWRDININEKMNLPFGYEADEENGNQQFIYILLKALKEGVNDTTPLIAFPGLDDRFTTPMKLGEISNLMVGTPYSQPVVDWVKDPTGNTMKDSMITDDFNAKAIQTFRLKEEVIFDKKTSRLHFRILGIAPLKKSKVEGGGEFPIFWIYYPDIRPILAKHEAYNPRNSANRLSWEEVFESRYFSSRIVKSSLNNNSNRYIEGMIKDPILRLVESDNIKEQIFNFEQSQWSY